MTVPGNGWKGGRDMKQKRSGLGFEKNDSIELVITGMTAEGNGVGRHRDVAVFVPGAAIGDSLKVRVVKTAKNHAFGKIEQILTPSPDRIAVDCPVFSQCGGCVYRHLSYEAEQRVKEQRVRDAITRLAGLPELDIAPLVGAQQPDGYRNKAQLPIGRDADGRLVVGFYAPRSHRIVACDTCALQPEVFARAVQAFRQWEQEHPQTVYEETTGTGKLRHLYLRQARATGELMVCVVVNGNRLSGEERLAELLREHTPELTSLILNENRERTNVILGKNCRTLWGQDAITDVLCGLRFRISPLSFYQVNRDQAERLYEKAADYAGLTGRETVLDLYCGTGTIGLSMAGRAGKLLGVEVVPEAVEDARRNARENGVGNAEFFCGDAAQAAQRLLARGERPDVVVLDPPRKGCDAALIDAVAQMSPPRVVYVSCDPATLARDLTRFAPAGYRAHALTPFDLFPRTAHVECVVRLEREHPCG